MTDPIDESLKEHLKIQRRRAWASARRWAMIWIGLHVGFASILPYPQCLYLAGFLLSLLGAWLLAVDWVMRREGLK